MPAAAEPVRGFSLADFDGPGQPADVATIDPKTGVVIAPAAPEPRPEPEPTPTAEPAPVPEREEPETPERPENEPTDKVVDDEAPQSLNEAMDEQARSGTDAAKEKAAAAKKAADDAAVEKAKADGAKPTTEAKERDADLKVELGAHVRPSTRKIITDFQAKATAARDKEEAAVARAEAAEAKARELEEKAKTVEPPKELVEENKRLLERVRELDITKDPALEAKYDRRITANQTSIVDVLKAQGFGTIRKEDGTSVDNPKAIAELLKSGLTYETLHPLIQKLKEGGLHADARKIERLIDQNESLSEERQAEIESWKGDYEKRQQSRQQETKQQQEKRQAEFRQQTDLQLNAAIDELAKNFSYIKKPAAPLPTDTPATVQAKNKAIADYDAAAKQIESDVAALDPGKAPPEKFAQTVGRINASAIQAIILQRQVLPRVIKEMQAKDARIKALEAEVGKIVNAGKLSRTQSSTTEERNAAAGKQEATSLEDAFGAGPQ